MRPSSSARCRRSLPQVDEIVVIANLPGSVGQVPSGVRVIENPRPLPLAANVNAGIAATSGAYVLFANPDAVAEPAAPSAALRGVHGRAPALRHRGPADPVARRHLAAVAPALSDGRRDDRAPHAAAQALPAVRASARALPPRRAPDGAGRGRLDARCVPAPAPHDARARSAAGMRAIGTTSRTSTSVTARCGPAGSAGTSRRPSSRHAYAAVIDKTFLSRHTLWHLRGMARFARKHPEALVRQRP